ncbi:pupal cuticle protein-like [Stomoxys calcitrans]|uniref:Pupal cuticle protein Edg-78E-like n=1 Tax=Stomoxys calcitrans TaxID=35570 RepID=A0A1I8PA43_STOCA|nr:pupal cuticle protein-like [Stomoxys calcitrans]
MNKFLLTAIVVATLAYGVFAGGGEDDVHADTYKFESNVEYDGTFNYVFETTNGITAEEKSTGPHSVKGGFAYYSPEGELITMSYVADENGFHPKSTILPTPPPIPPAILRSLEYIRTHQKKSEN